MAGATIHPAADELAARPRRLPWDELLSSLSIEYSLLERSVEQELVPMAKELGLSITPWSPLKSGALSGKYKRANAQARRQRTRLR